MPFTHGFGSVTSRPQNKLSLNEGDYTLPKKLTSAERRRKKEARKRAKKARKCSR